MAAKGDQESMSKAKLLVAVFIAVLSVSALASASASAAPAEWMLNKKTLAEEGLTTAALKTTAKVDKKGVLSGGGVTIECTGELLEGVSPEIIKENQAKAKALIFSGCRVTVPTSSCSVATTIGTAPVEGEVTLDGALAVKGVIKPQTGTLFTTLVLSGNACPAEKDPVTGDVEVLAPEGQDERTDQLLEVNQAASGLLKIGSGAASLTGAALLLLANNAAWSFL